MFVNEPINQDRSKGSGAYNALPLLFGTEDCRSFNDDKSVPPQTTCKAFHPEGRRICACGDGL
jgi:hypothetical protein